MERGTGNILFMEANAQNQSVVKTSSRHLDILIFPEREMSALGVHYSSLFPVVVINTVRKTKKSKLERNGLIWLTYPGYNPSLREARKETLAEVTEV